MIKMQSETRSEQEDTGTKEACFVSEKKEVFGETEFSLYGKVA